MTQFQLKSRQIRTVDQAPQKFEPLVKNLVVLRGGMSAKDRKRANTALNVADDVERLMLAIGRYIGGGFDDARLDTLFLTMPIAWKKVWRSMLDVCIVSMMASGTSWLSITSTVLFRCWPAWPQSDAWIIARWAIRWNEGAPL